MVYLSIDVFEPTSLALGTLVDGEPALPPLQISRDQRHRVVERISAQRARNIALLMVDPDFETFRVEVVLAELACREALLFHIQETDWTVLVISYLRHLTLLSLLHWFLGMVLPHYSDRGLALLSVLKRHEPF